MTNVGDCFDMAEKAAKYEIIKEMFEAGVIDIEGASNWSMLEEFLITRPNFSHKLKINMERLDFPC
jgi:hypothetical protein